MSIGPSKRQDDRERQRIRGNAQVEIGRTVHQYGGNAPEAGKGNCFVVLAASFAVPDG